MITKDNFKVYSSLFEEINKALGYDEQSYKQVYYTDAADYTDDTRKVYVAVFDESGKVVIDYQDAPVEYDPNLSYFIEVVGISDIDDYFMELENIKQYVVGKDGDISNPENDPYFLILPQDDEPLFNINANTRKIDVPTDFIRNGIAVQGDELAEIVYFAIDRYFDTTDLYEKDILIQWEAPLKAGQMEPKKGLSVTVNKSLALMPGKVVFGWPITNDITETAGNVKFAVRFYDRIEDPVTKKEMLAYSWSTLTATAKINTALDFQIADSEAITALIVDKNKLIYDNLRNSSAEGVDVEATAPTFIVEAFSPIQTSTIDGLPVYDLSATLKFSGRASFTAEDDVEGFGTLSYRWLRKVQKKPTDKLQEFEIEDIPEYVKLDQSKVTQKLNYDSYYYKPGDKYIPYLGQIPTDFDIYQRYATCFPSAAGEYYLIANNNAGRGNNKQTMTSNFWKVPFAAEPQFTYPMIEVPAVDEEGEPTTEMVESRNIIMRQSDENGVAYADLDMAVSVADSGTLSHQWYYSATAVDKPATGLGEANKLPDEIGVSLKNVKQEGFYYLFASNFKNEDTTDAYSESIRVTLPAQKVTIRAYLVDGQPQVADSTGLMVRLNGTTKTIGVLVNDEGIPTDGISYQWYDIDGNEISGATAATYTVASAGVLKVVVTNTYNTDTITDESYQFIIMP